MSVGDCAGGDYKLFVGSGSESSVPLLDEPQVTHHSDGGHRPLRRPVRDGGEMEESFSQADSQLLLAALEKAVALLRGQVADEQSEAAWYGCLVVSGMFDARMWYKSPLYFVGLFLTVHTAKH